VAARAIARAASAVTDRIHAKCTAVSTAGDEVIPEEDSASLAPRLHLRRDIFHPPFEEPR
jgi:hypothetical protein